MKISCLIHHNWYDPSKVRFKFWRKFLIVQFYVIEHNSKSNRWIELKFDMKISEVLVSIWVKFQMNWSSGRICDISQNMLYAFYYLLPFDLCTLYLARILFLQGCDSLFWKSPSSTRIFNELQYSFQVWQWFINVLESFSYNDSLFILAITRKEDFIINSTFISDFLVYLELLKGDKSDSNIFRIAIFRFLLFLLFSS
jgi:hypothetical protein